MAKSLCLTYFTFKSGSQFPSIHFGSDLNEYPYLRIKLRDVEVIIVY